MAKENKTKEKVRSAEKSCCADTENCCADCCSPAPKKKELKCTCGGC